MKKIIKEFIKMKGIHKTILDEESYAKITQYLK